MWRAVQDEKQLLQYSAMCDKYIDHLQSPRYADGCTSVTCGDIGTIAITVSGLTGKRSTCHGKNSAHLTKLPTTSGGRDLLPPCAKPQKIRYKIILYKTLSLPVQIYEISIIVSVVLVYLIICHAHLLPFCSIISHAL